MGVPKRRTSKCRIRSRVAANNAKRQYPQAAPCPKCGAPRLPHRVCPACGVYADRQVKVISAD